LVDRAKNSLSIISFRDLAFNPKIHLVQMLQIAHINRKAAVSAQKRFSVFFGAATGKAIDFFRGTNDNMQISAKKL